MRFHIIEHYNNQKLVMCECHVLDMAQKAFEIWISKLPEYCSAIELYDSEEKLTIQKLEIM